MALGAFAAGAFLVTAALALGASVLAAVFLGAGLAALALAGAGALATLAVLPAERLLSAASIPRARLRARALRGSPSVTAAPSPIISTWSKASLAPGSPSSFSTISRSPAWTRYCLPPVLITAYIDWRLGIDTEVRN